MGGRGREGNVEKREALLPVPQPTSRACVMDFLQRRQVQAAAEQLRPDLVLKFEALHLLLRAGIISHIDQVG